MKTTRWILSVGLSFGVMCCGWGVSQVCAAEKLVAPEAGAELPPPLKRFVATKEKQVRRVAERVGMELAPEIEEFFKVAGAGDWMQAMSLYRDARRAVRGGTDDPDQRALEAVQSAALLEVELAFEQIMETDSTLALRLGEAMMASVPRSAIYFGGTDPGRGLPTALSAAHDKGNPFFTLTQNALADGQYLVYLREMYGGQLSIPTEEDSQKAFQDYLSDAQRRLQHDQDHPTEPRQIRPGEDVRVNKNRVQVSGQVAVMSINGRLSKVIFDQNPDREFFVEESFPLDWMYPHLVPQGIIMKMQRDPLSRIAPADVEKDQAYWAGLQQPLIGDWLKPATSLEDVCRFVRKLYVDRNKAGFSGDPKFVETEAVRKTYGKLRAAVGGVYAWRRTNAADPKEKERMSVAADAAFKQAYAFCPTSPEVVFRYVELLQGQNRKADALTVAELAANLDPGQDSFANLVTELQKLQLPGPNPKDQPVPVK